MIIAVDLDNTLNDFAQAWLRMLNRRYGLSVQYDSLKNYQMEKNFPMLKPDEVNDILSKPRFWNAEMKPQPGSVDTLRYLSVYHDIYVVTARTYPHHMDAVMWLKLWFPFIPERRIVFAPDKSVIKCDALIDDCPTNLVRGDCETIQFAQPWNLDNRWGDKICRSWENVYNSLRSTKSMFHEIKLTERRKHESE